MNSETLRRYARIISNCESYEDAEFVIEQMFNLYVPSKSEIESFLDENLLFYTSKVAEICDRDQEKQEKLYSEIRRQAANAIRTLFQKRFERLGGLQNNNYEDPLNF